MKQDIEIAQETKIRPIVKIADKLGIPHDELELYGKYKAKIPLHFIDEEKIKNSLKSLEKKEIINLEEKGNEVFVKLKDKNNSTIIKYSIKALLGFKKKEKRWNGKWFLVFFDVPEIQRNKRNYLRKYLLNMGFYRYQQSIYIFPYECEKEIILIKKIVEGAKYMKYIIADKIEDEKDVKTFFKLN